MNPSLSLSLIRYISLNQIHRQSQIRINCLSLIQIRRLSELDPLPEPVPEPDQLLINPKGIEKCRRDIQSNR
jgi:hypothetical protein